MNTDIVLQTHHLQKIFGAVRAVEDVSLEVKRCKVLGFLGPNGAGKTTTIGMILGLIHPTAGSVQLFGEAVTPTRTVALRRTGALVGAPAFVPYLSARVNLGLTARLHPGLRQARVDEVLELVGLREAAHRPAGRFSSGMKQRLGLAMALLHQPELLILDEPTNGMDPAGMREMRNLLRELANQGVTVFLSSHLLHEVEQVCDEVVVLNKGLVVAQGAVSSLLGSQTIVRVRVESPAEAAAVLHTLPGASDIQPNGAWVTVGGVSSQAVIAHLTSHGIVPFEVSSGRPDLESLFLELTQAEQPS
jgi:ABC-2 type transport system ATP-binding protein